MVLGFFAFKTEVIIIIFICVFDKEKYTIFFLAEFDFGKMFQYKIFTMILWVE